MWILKYCNDHFIRIIKNTYNSLGKKLVLPIIMIAVPMIIAGFIENTYSIKILISILCGFGGLVSYCFLVFLFHLFKTPIDIYKEDKETIELLEEQQKPKLEIIFNETSKDHCSEYVQNEGQTWRISVCNKSTTTLVKNVTVKLTEVYEGLSLVDDRRVRLKFKHCDRLFVDIHAGDKELVDVFEWIIDKENPRFDIRHIEVDKISNAIRLYYYIDKENYRIKIEAFGEGVSPISRFFTISKRKNGDIDFIYMDAD